MSHNFASAPTLEIDVKGTKFVYRAFGVADGTPVVFLHHLTAVLEDWDPRIVDGIAASHPVVIFDNRGVGGTEGETPTTVEAMAEDAVAFMHALGLRKVHLLGFSLGGFVAQAILQRHPEMVEKAILAGTGPAGGMDGINEGALLQSAFAKAAETGKHPKHFLFFAPTASSQAAGARFIARLQERKDDRDPAATSQTVGAQLAAIAGWAKGDPRGLISVTHPVFVANGDDDIMVPTADSFELARLLPNATLSIYPDAGHGGIFQYHDTFVEQSLAFLARR